MITIETHCLPMAKPKNSSDVLANFMDYISVRQKKIKIASRFKPYGGNYLKNYHK